MDAVLSSILSPEKVVTKAMIGEVPTADNISRTTSSGQTAPDEFHNQAVKESQNALFLPTRSLPNSLNLVILNVSLNVSSIDGNCSDILPK